MEQWQSFGLWGLMGLSAFLFWRSIYECKEREGTFRETPYLNLLGIIVWADGLIFAPFWFLVSGFCLWRGDFVLFLLITSVFWVVRSLGETIYWFNQQFSTINRNDPKRLFGYSIVKNDAIWFLYQILWQCISVISVVTTIYLSHLWLS